MKKFLLFLGLFFATLPSFSQLLSWTPNFAQESTTPFVITVDASKGNQQLFFYTPVTDVYVHIGVITNLSTSSSDWRYSKFTWGSTAAAAQATSLGNSKWSFTITGGLRTFFGVPAGETIQKIAILFRNGTGAKKQANTDGTDMYIPVYTTTLAARFSLPLMQPTFIPQPETITKVVGNTIPMTGISNNAATLNLYFNGSLVQTAAAATTISNTPTITTTGLQTLVLQATSGVTDKRDTIRFYVPGTVNVAALPAGVRDGINYSANTTQATLVLYAPGKSRVGVIGDFLSSNWQEQSAYQMNKTPDGNYWWITLTGLTPGTEYSFQYIVDGTLRIADPYSEKILDPYNDQYITAATYPGLKAYPTGITSNAVSILQTAAPAYTWHNNTFTRPDKRKIVIYELLLRDFVAAHDWNTLRDSLRYLRNLGVTAIELMPSNEFEGNESWGYNPDFYFAPDKYYGPANTMKRFIDSCHSKGIAVIMDIALNHSFGMSPMVQLYWDAANNRPAANNPWFNPVPKHAYNVGYDMNHESLATRYYVSRIMEHWLVNYKIDGFRFDLSKGFTQTQTCDANGNNCNVATWSNYDASRIAIWKRYYDTLQLKSPGCYAILEHFADNSEETELSNYGMMPWGNMNYNFNQASMGFSTDWNFDYGLSVARGWTNPYLVTYMESHDEERLMYKNLQFGNSNGAYNVKTLATALKRMELCGAFFFTQPGPKMIWQFGELGYDFSINTCPDLTVNSNCRTDKKPIHWEYFQNANRNALYHVWGPLANLRKNPIVGDLFTSNNVTRDFSGAFKWMKVVQGTMSIVVIGNFDVVAQTGSVTFPTAGTFFNYFAQTPFTATGSAQSFTLQPGEYRVYLSVSIGLPVSITSFNGRNNGKNNLLSWKVENEQDLDHYELERSINGKDFIQAGNITATGNGNYTYTDDISSVRSTVYFYRLKSVDKDGDFKYSGIVKINVTANAGFIEVNPNPFPETLFVNIESAIKDEATIAVTDLSGRQLLKKVIGIAAGNNTLEIKEAANLNKGMYILTVNTSAQRQSIKIVKGK
ncbi:MAG: alpha-amylase family glycosyl hydrolase [Ferruginibacter sp.]